jgi:tetratricopeptide (TPR) repeat protein
MTLRLVTILHSQRHLVHLGPRFGRWAVALCIGVLSAMSMPVSAQNAPPNICGDLRNAYGPYDYRTDFNKLPIVESSHFTPEVDALIRGKNSYVGGDLDYTLRAFPNHHRALASMMKLAEREKNRQPVGARYTVECYFERAVRFAPDDTIVRMLFATDLNKIGRVQEANQQLEESVKLAGNDPFAQYNAGLVYFDMKNYAKALHQAQVAYALGFARPELRDALKAVGRWVEPPADAATAPASAPGPSAPAAAPAASQVR